MARETKRSDVRRQQLIDIGEELFTKNGYDETAVSDIVGAAGIAQGTFYHHFRSKEELLEAISDRYIDDLNQILEGLVADEGLSAVEKLVQLFARIRAYSFEREGMVMYLHEERNLLLHHKLEQKLSAIWMPLLRSIIVQGVVEGTFETRYPEEAAIAIISITGTFSHTGEKVTQDLMRRRTVAAFFEIIERILGARSGTLQEYIEKMGST